VESEPFISRDRILAVENTTVKATSNAHSIIPQQRHHDRELFPSIKAGFILLDRIHKE
jgi:hypothetical protein